MAADPLLARLFAAAEPQANCVSRRQLEAVGIGRGAVVSLQRRGALHRAAPRTFVVGVPELSDEQLRWVGLLAAGSRGRLASWSAGALWKFVEAPTSDVWVSRPSSRGEQEIETQLPIAATGRPGRIHLVAAGGADGLLRVDGLPVESPSQTMVRIAASGTPQQALAAWSEADYRNLLRLPALEGVLGRGVPGTARVRELMRAHPIVNDGHTDLATRAEFMLLAAVLAAGVPRPRTNWPLVLDGTVYYPDQFHADVGLVVEVDGGVHGRARRAGQDAARTSHMRRHGYGVLRVPNADIERDADECAQRVVAARTARIGRAA